MYILTSRRNGIILVYVCTYLPLEGSVDYSHANANGVQILPTQLKEVQYDYPFDSFIVLGDFNARVGLQNDFTNDNV
jgi:hypothetical protein